MRAALSGKQTRWSPDRHNLASRARVSRCEARRTPSIAPNRAGQCWRAIGTKDRGGHSQSLTAISPHQNSKVVGGDSVPTTLPCPPIRRLPGKAQRVVEPAVGERPHTRCPPSCTKGPQAAGPTRDHRSASRPFWGAPGCLFGCHPPGIGVTSG
jgi:hypothetical protein